MMAQAIETELLYLGSLTTSQAVGKWGSLQNGQCGLLLVTAGLLLAPVWNEAVGGRGVIESTCDPQGCKSHRK